MKRIVIFAMLIAMASMVMLWATPAPPEHKILWCHYPPGQWTNVAGDASHVIILSIDVAATGFDRETAKHLGHSPIFTPSGLVAEGEYVNGACPSPQTLTCDVNGGLVPGVSNGVPTCVCAPGTLHPGVVPPVGGCNAG